MYKKYFPSCKVESPIEPPMKYMHLGSEGAIPKKCSECKYLFEGECSRNIENGTGYLHLDYGHCKVNGPTDPVIYESAFVQSKVKIPRKCKDCGYLKFDKTRGFICTEEEYKWGNLSRGLDWGTWEPDTVYLQLPLPKWTTRKLTNYVKADNLINFIKEYREVNSNYSIEEAKKDFAYLKEQLEK